MEANRTNAERSRDTRGEPAERRRTESAEQQGRRFRRAALAETRAVPPAPRTSPKKLPANPRRPESFGPREQEPETPGAPVESRPARLGLDPKLRKELEHALAQARQAAIGGPPGSLLPATEPLGEDEHSRRRPSGAEVLDSCETDASPLLTWPASTGAPGAPGAQRAAPPWAHGIDPALLRQIVRFATFGQNHGGVAEFRIGFQQEVLAGAVLKIRALGSRRVSLSLKGGTMRAGEDEVRGLIEALKRRGLDVVEVEVC